MKFYLLFIFIFFVFSCTPTLNEIELPDIPTEEIDSILIWKTPKNLDTTRSTSAEPLCYNNRIIFSNHVFGSNENEEIIAIDLEGNEAWRWSAFIDENKIQEITPDWRILNNKLVFSSWKDNYCLDIDSGLENWRFIHPHGSPRISIGLNNMVMKPIKYKDSSPRGDSTTIMIADVNEGEFQEVFKIRKTGEHEVSIPNAIAYLDTEGDTILIFQCNNLRIAPYEEVIDFYSYNLTKKEVAWAHYGLTNLSWNVHEPIVDDEYIYFATKFTVFCFEKETGNIVWQRQLYHDFQGSNYLLYEDLLITNLDNGDLIAISKHNGETVWVQEKLSACCTELRIYDDKIYMGNGDLFIIQAETGEVLFRYTTPTKKESGRSGALFLKAIAVDLENQRMYATDGYYLLCLKHPDL